MSENMPWSIKGSVMDGYNHIADLILHRDQKRWFQGQLTEEEIFAVKHELHLLLISIVFFIAFFILAWHSFFNFSLSWKDPLFWCILSAVVGFLTYRKLTFCEKIIGENQFYLNQWKVMWETSYYDLRPEHIDEIICKSTFIIGDASSGEVIILKCNSIKEFSVSRRSAYFGEFTDEDGFYYGFWIEPSQGLA